MKKLIVSFLYLLHLLLATSSANYANAASTSKGKVLVVLSNAADIALQNNKRYATGYFLNELAVPVKALLEAGYTPVFASPSGAAVAWDSHSLDKKFFGNNEKLMNDTANSMKNLPALKAPLPLADVARQGANEFVGIFVPGGHGPINDLSRNVHLGLLLKQFHQQAKPTALICHGPIALLAALPNPESFINNLSSADKSDQEKNIQAWPYAGYRMTVFSTAEERIAEQYQLGGNVIFYPAEALAEAGALVETGKMWQSHVVKDRELITGQQPFSDGELATLFIEALDAYRSIR